MKPNDGGLAAEQKVIKRGERRECLECSKHFYDLNTSLAICPYCKHADSSLVKREGFTLWSNVQIQNGPPEYGMITYIGYYGCTVDFGDGKIKSYPFHQLRDLIIRYESPLSEDEFVAIEEKEFQFQPETITKTFTVVGWTT